LGIGKKKGTNVLSADGFGGPGGERGHEEDLREREEKPLRRARGWSARLVLDHENHR